MLWWALSHKQWTDVAWFQLLIFLSLILLMCVACVTAFVWRISVFFIHLYKWHVTPQQLLSVHILCAVVWPLSWFSCTSRVHWFSSDQLQTIEVDGTAWFPLALSARPRVYRREFLSEPRQSQHTSKGILASNHMKEPLIGPGWCIFTFYDQPSRKQLALMALDLNTGLFTHKHTHKHMNESTKTGQKMNLYETELSTVE